MFLDSLSGETLGQYKLGELLGAGGMGAVYRAYQESLHREVAVKVIYTRVAGNAEYEERFAREARMAAALEHSHIVPIYDFGTQHSVSYVVMRQLSGGSLSERISQHIAAFNATWCPFERHRVFVKEGRIG